MSVDRVHSHVVFLGRCVSVDIITIEGFSFGRLPFGVRDKSGYYFVANW